MSTIAITPRTTVPTGLPSAVLEAFHADGGNAIELFGKCNANTGRLYLLRNDGVASDQWYPVDLDAQDLDSIHLDAAAPAGALAGYFSGTWLTGDGTPAWYVVLATGTPTFELIFAATRRL